MTKFVLNPTFYNSSLVTIATTSDTVSWSICGFPLSFIHNTRMSASVEHHGVQPTGCMDNEPEPSRGVPC